MASWLGRLSPRRRIFATSLAALLAAVVVVVVISVVLASQHSAAGQPAGYPAQDRTGPVLLVPGYGGNTNSLDILARRIRATGRQATVLHLPGNGTGSLAGDASVLNAAVSHALRQGAPSVDVIGYSAGGVATLLWARDDGGAHKARRIVTLGAPFHGAELAADGEAFLPNACPAACRQLVPGSSLLTQLQAGITPSRPAWLSLWSIDDKTVDPPDSARLAGAVNVPIQSLCPAQQISHSQLPTNSAVTAMVLQAIGTGPVQPSPADCR
ncbi:MAG TPA: alpha/beta hydrolase [Streptosporangiaceae bacterium]